MHQLVQDRRLTQGKSQSKSKSKSKVNAHPNYDSYSRYAAKALNPMHDFSNADMVSDLKLEDQSLLSSPKVRDYYEKRNQEGYSNFTQQKMPVSLLTSIQKLGGKKHTVQPVKKGRASSSLLCPTASSKNKDVSSKSQEKFELERVKKIQGLNQNPYCAQSQLILNHQKTVDKSQLEAQQLIQSIQELSYRGKSQNSRRKGESATKKTTKSKLNRSVLQQKKQTNDDDLKYIQRATQSSSFLQRSAAGNERHCKYSHQVVEADENETCHALQQATIAHFRKTMSQSMKKSARKQKRDSGGFIHQKVKKMSKDYFNAIEKQRKDSKIVTPFANENETVTQNRADNFFIENMRQTPREESPNKHNWVSDTVNMEPNVIHDIDTELKEKRKKLGNLYLQHSIKQKTRSRSRSKNNSRTKTPEKLVSPKNDYQLHQQWVPKRSVTPSVCSNQRDHDSIPNPYYVKNDYTTFMSKQTSSPKNDQSPIVSINAKKSSQKRSKVEMQNKLRFLHQNLGAVFKGYKCRRIYHNNKVIKQYRQEFRDLIQFAYQLKQEIVTQQQMQAAKSKMDQTKRMLLTSLKDLISKRHQFAQHFNKLLSGEANNHNQSTASLKGSVLEWMVESQPIEIQNLSSQLRDTAISQNQSAVNLEEASNSYQYMSDTQNLVTPQNMSPKKRDLNTSHYKQYVQHKLEPQQDTRNSIMMAANPNSIYNEESNHSNKYIKRRSIPNRNEPVRESNHTFGKNTINVESRHQTIQDRNSITSPTNDFTRSKSQQLIKQTTPVRTINLGERSESQYSKSNVSRHSRKNRTGNFQRKEMPTEIQDLGLGQQFIKSMHSIKSMNSIKLDCASRERSLSQTKQNYDEKSSQKIVEKKSFLKKGSQSRIYDPNKSIMQERLANQEAEEIKLRNQNYNTSTGIPQIPVHFQSNFTSEYTTTQQENPPSKIHDTSKSPIRSIKKFQQEYVSPYSQVRKAPDDTSPVREFQPQKDFTQENIDRVKKISDQTKMEKMKMEAVEQTQEIIQSNLNQRNQGFELGKSQSLEQDKKGFVSKIPRLSQSIGRGKTAEPVERVDRLKNQRPSSSPQRLQVERVNRPQEVRALSSSPQKRNLVEMNEIIKEQNKTYVQNLQKKKSPDHSRRTSGAVLADLLMNKGDQTNLEVVQSFSSQTRGVTYSKEDNCAKDQNQFGGLSFSRLSRGSINSKSGQNQKSNNRYHKKENSDVSQCGTNQMENIFNNKIATQKSQPIQKPEIMKDKQMTRSNDKKYERLRSPTPQKKLQEIVQSPSPERNQQQIEIANCIQNNIKTRMDSITSSTACGLQQIIDKFSPLKHQNFQNKYIQKRSVERQSNIRLGSSQCMDQDSDSAHYDKVLADNSDSLKPSSVCPSPMNIAHVVPHPIQHNYQMPPRILDAQSQSQLQRDIIMKEAEDQIQRIQGKLNGTSPVRQFTKKNHDMVYENQVEMFDQSQRQFDLAMSSLAGSQVNSVQRNSKFNQTNKSDIKSMVSHPQVFEIQEESSNQIDETERSKTPSIPESLQASSKDTANSFKLIPQKVNTGRDQINSQQSNYYKSSNTAQSVFSNPCSQPMSPPTRVKVDRQRMQNELKQRMKNKENPCVYSKNPEVTRNKSRRSRGQRNQSSQKTSNRISQQQQSQSQSNQNTIEQKACTSILRIPEPSRNEFSCLTSPAHKKTPAKPKDQPYAANTYSNNPFGTLSGQKKRLSQSKKSTFMLSSKDTLFKPVLQEKRQNILIASPKQKDQSITLSIMSPSQAGAVDPMQQIQKAIQTMMDQQKAQSPRKAQKMQEMIKTLQSQVNEMNDIL